MSVAGSSAYKASRGNWEIDDPGASGALPNDKSGVVNLVSAAAEGRTLANPVKSGQRLTLALAHDGGTITVTTSSTLEGTGNGSIVLDDLGDDCELLSVGRETAYNWQVVGGYGYGIS